jgi:hypothetical protein
MLAATPPEEGKTIKDLASREGDVTTRRGVARAAPETHERKPAKPKVLVGFALACAAAALLCLIGGLVIIGIYGFDTPWARSMSKGLGGLFTVFALGYYAFKLLILLWGE